VIDRPSQAIIYGKREFIVPNFETSLPETLSQRADKRILIPARMANENIPFHFLVSFISWSGHLVTIV
jgi:hypothetical protein